MRRFTLIEIVVVLTVFGLALALVLPRVGRLPARLVIERALSSVTCAFRDAATRARATGRPVRLVLDAEQHRLRIEKAEDADVWASTPALANRADGAEPAAGEPSRRPRLLERLTEYRLAAELEWDLSGMDTGEGDAPGFTFYPGGEAAGTPLSFKLRSKAYTLDVDRLTGRPLLLEAD